MLEKDLANNRLIVGQGHDHPRLQSKSLVAYQVDWVVAPPPQVFDTDGLRCTAKTRYRQPDQACTLYADNADASRVRVVFDAPQRAVTPGQSCVLYADAVCLGGGVIESIYP